MKLYATITKANGKSEGMGDNDDLVVNFYYKNKVVYMVRLAYENVGDIEEPTMDLLITSRDYRLEAKKQKSDKKCEALLDYNIPCNGIATHGDFCKKCADKIPL